MVRQHPAVSVVMAVRNEARHLRDALDAVCRQDYRGPVEVVLAVGPSDDGTHELAARLAEADPRVTVVANPAGVTPAGLNRALVASTGEVVVRVDGHAILPDGYIARAVELLAETGADNVGGIMDAHGETPLEMAVAAAMSSRFGTGDAKFHYGGDPGPADTVYLGVFRREALERVGGYDETFVRAQDAELNHRIRSSGGIVYFHPDLRVAYRPRSSLRGLARQYFHYGRWRRVVVRRHPGSLAWRQAVPPIALIGVVAGFCLAAMGRRIGLLAPGVYAAGVLGATGIAGRGLPVRAARWLPLVFATMHGAWALGFLTSPRSLGTQSGDR